MFEGIMKFFKKFGKAENQENSSKETAKERLHLVLMQDRANVSADFLEMMKQEIIEVIKKYIDVDENAIDVRLTNKTNEDGTNGAPALYANIPIISIKEEKREIKKEEKVSQEQKENLDKQSVKEKDKIEKEKQEETSTIEKQNEMKSEKDEISGGVESEEKKEDVESI